MENEKKSKKILFLFTASFCIYIPFLLYLNGSLNMSSIKLMFLNYYSMLLFFICLIEVFVIFVISNKNEFLINFINFFKYNAIVLLFLSYISITLFTDYLSALIAIPLLFFSQYIMLSFLFLPTICIIFSNISKEKEISISKKIYNTIIIIIISFNVVFPDIATHLTRSGYFMGMNTYHFYLYQKKCGYPHSPFSQPCQFF